MWICLNDGFISAVCSKDDPNVLVVRARNDEHLTNVFPDKEILIWEKTDYPYRVLVTKQEFKDVVLSRIDSLDYTDFKDSVDDDALHEMYFRFWRTGVHYEEYIMDLREQELLDNQSKV